MSPSVFADDNAGAAVLPAAWDAYVAAAKLSGNPSSSHRLGLQAKAALENARAEVGRALGADLDEVVFVSGGSEANALALTGVVRARQQGAEARPHVVMTALEHASVARTLRGLGAEGQIDLSVVAANRRGVVEPEVLAAALRPSTALVALIAASNETGVVQPVATLAAQIRAVAANAHVHVDGVQAVGRTEVSLSALGADTLAIAGHKLGAVLGSGALLVRRGVHVVPLFGGGGQERGLRAGTENVAGAASLAAALRENPWAKVRHSVGALRDAVEAELRQRLEGIEVLGEGSTRLCNTSCLRIAGCAGEAVAMALDVDGVQLSTGSACATGSVEPSPVLLGMGLSEAEARQCVRISWTWAARTEEATTLTDALVRVVGKLRAAASR